VKLTVLILLSDDMSNTCHQCGNKRRNDIWVSFGAYLQSGILWIIVSRSGSYLLKMWPFCFKVKLYVQKFHTK